MRILAVLAAVAFAAIAIAIPDIAEAKRLGGARSLGAQRPSVAPSAPAPSAPAANAAKSAAPATPAVAAPPPASGASRWLGPLAGLAAGIGLAALFSHFGMSEGFGSIVMLMLVVAAGFFVLRFFLARRTPGVPMRYAAAPPAGAVPPLETPTATPAWGGASRLEPENASPQAAASNRWPADFDAPGFLKQAKIQFATLQSAYDAGDRAALADVTTPEMYTEIANEIATRGDHRATEFVTVDAQLLEVTTEGANHWASVRFTGLSREDGALLPADFAEDWHLSKPVDGSSGWLLAGIQQLETHP